MCFNWNSSLIQSQSTDTQIAGPLRLPHSKQRQRSFGNGNSNQPLVLQWMQMTNQYGINLLFLTLKISKLHQSVSLRWLILVTESMLKLAINRMRKVHLRDGHQSLTSGSHFTHLESSPSIPKLKKACKMTQILMKTQMHFYSQKRDFRRFMQFQESENAYLAFFYILSIFSVIVVDLS